MPIRLASFITLVLGCQFARAKDLTELARATRMPVAVCAQLMMMAEGPLRTGTEDPLRGTLERMTDHVRNAVQSVETMIDSGTPIPNATFDLILDPARENERLTYFYGDDAEVTRAVLSAANTYFFMRYRGRGYLDYKMHGRLVDYDDRGPEGVPNLKPGRHDALVGDLMLAAQRLNDLLRAQPAYRARYREWRRTHHPKTIEIPDDEFFGGSKDPRDIFWFRLDQDALPEDVRVLRGMDFTTYTEDHSFSHFATSSPLTKISDALRLARDTVTTVISSRLTARDVFQLLHVMMMQAPIPIDVNLAGWAKNKAQGRPLLPATLTFPSGAAADAPPFTLGLVICTATPCRVKDLDFRAGELVSVFPIAGPGVVRIPPARDLRRALIAGDSVFDEAKFKPAPVTAPKVLEAH